MNTRSYEEFVNTTFDNAIKNKQLISCMMNLTYRCNNKCIHCYCVDNEEEKREMSTQKVLDTLKELRKEGCLFLALSGGEPLLRKDFCEIYTCAKEMGFILTVFTNATLIDNNIANMFEKYKPMKVNISIYGSDEKTYERISSIKGSYKKFVNGVSLLRDRNINLDLRTIMMVENYDDISRIQQKAYDLSGKYCKFDPFIFDDLQYSGLPLNNRVSPDKILQYEITDEVKTQKMMKIHEGYLLKENVQPMYSPIYHCKVSGVIKININPYGIVSLCNMFSSEGYSLYNYNVAEARNMLVNEFKLRFVEPYSSDVECIKCKCRHFCLQCPAVAYTEHKNYYQKSEYACAIAHNRFSEYSKKRRIENENI